VTLRIRSDLYGATVNRATGAELRGNCSRKRTGQLSKELNPIRQLGRYVRAIKSNRKGLSGPDEQKTRGAYHLHQSRCVWRDFAWVPAHSILPPFRRGGRESPNQALPICDRRDPNPKAYPERFTAPSREVTISYKSFNLFVVLWFYGCSIILIDNEAIAVMALPPIEEERKQPGEARGGLRTRRPVR
jgi:hypothetical protein